MRGVLALAAALAAGPQAYAASATATSQNPLAAVRLEDLAATRDRPLFSPSRRPPPPPVEAAAPAVAPAPAPVLDKPAEAEPPPFDLVGAVVGELKSYVLLRDRATNEVVRLRQGDERDGWRVGLVSLRSVVMERDGRVEPLAIAIPSATGALAAPQLAGPTQTVGEPPDPAAAPPIVDPQPKVEAKHMTKRPQR